MFVDGEVLIGMASGETTWSQYSGSHRNTIHLAGLFSYDLFGDGMSYLPNNPHYFEVTLKMTYILVGVITLGDRGGKYMKQASFQYKDLRDNWIDLDGAVVCMMSNRDCNHLRHIAENFPTIKLLSM